jgi:pyruvate dehydrogenase phosphatase
VLIGFPSIALGDFVFKLPAFYSERVFAQKKPGWNDRVSAKMKLCNARNITPPYLNNEADVRHLEIPNAKEATSPRPFLILCSDGLIDQYDHFAHIPTLAQTWVDVVANSAEAGGECPSLIVGLFSSQPRCLRLQLDLNKALVLLKHALGGEDEDKVSQRLTVEFTREKWMDDTTVVVIQL